MMNLRTFLFGCCCLCTLVAHAQSNKAATEKSTRIVSYFKHSKQPKSIQHFGNFNGCGMPVGTDTLYTANGKLGKTISYSHQKTKQTGCHGTFTLAKQVSFFSNGHVKSIAYFKSLYEADPVACGNWQWFNDKGKLIRNQNKGSVKP